MLAVVIAHLLGGPGHGLLLLGQEQAAFFNSQLLQIASQAFARFPVKKGAEVLRGVAQLPLHGLKRKRLPQMLLQVFRHSGHGGMGLGGGGSAPGGGAHRQHQNFNQPAAHHFHIARLPLGVLPLHGLHQAADGSAFIVINTIGGTGAQGGNAELTQGVGKQRGEGGAAGKRPIHIIGGEQAIDDYEIRRIVIAVEGAQIHNEIISRGNGIAFQAQPVPGASVHHVNQL